MSSWYVLSLNTCHTDCLACRTARGSSAPAILDIDPINSSLQPSSPARHVILPCEAAFFTFAFPAAARGGRKGGGGDVPVLVAVGLETIGRGLGFGL